MIDIAREAGVSRMAVSAVLMGTGNGRIRVAPETADRIREIADGFNYRPNPAAQQLAGRRTGIIAIVAKDWKNYLTQTALSWLHEVAEEQGFRILTAQGGNGIASIERLVRDLSSGWIDGLVYFAYENEDQWPQVAKVLTQFSNAVVVAVGDLRIPGIPAVISDVAEGARQSFLHLVERGYRRPILVTEELESRVIQSRIEGYMAAAAQSGIEFNHSQIIVAGLGWILSDQKYYPHFEQLARNLLNEHRADAVICDSDFTAAGLIRACHRLKKSIPRDLAILGWGNLQFSSATTPMISTVSYELSSLLSSVVTCLQRQMDTPTDKSKDHTASQVELIAPRLIVREST